jgi:hypothetical protein
MLGPEVGEASREEVVAGLVGHPAAHVVGVDGVADEQEEIGGYPRKDAEDRVPLARLAAMTAAAQIAAPGEAHRLRVIGAGAVTNSLAISNAFWVAV